VALVEMGTHLATERAGMVTLYLTVGALEFYPSGPAVGNDSDKKEGKGELIKAPMGLQDLRRSLYIKAKAELTWRFWGLYVHICKMETLQEAYRMRRVTTEPRALTGSRLTPLRKAEWRVF